MDEGQHSSEVLSNRTADADTRKKYGGRFLRRNLGIYKIQKGANRIISEKDYFIMKNLEILNFTYSKHFKKN